MKKDILVKECIEILGTEKVETWYTKNFFKKPQEETINKLERALANNELTSREALAIAFVVGFQWLEKFPGVH